VKKLLAAAFVVCALGANAFAKCGGVPYEISGRITDSDGQAAADAAVQISWRESRGRTIQKLAAKTDVSGSYLVHLSHYEKSIAFDDNQPSAGTNCRKPVPLAAQTARGHNKPDVDNPKIYPGLLAGV
jgi:hypothetical protein